VKYVVEFLQTRALAERFEASGGIENLEAWLPDDLADDVPGYLKSRGNDWWIVRTPLNRPNDDIGGKDYTRLGHLPNVERKECDDCGSAFPAFMFQMCDIQSCLVCDNCVETHDCIYDEEVGLRRKMWRNAAQLIPGIKYVLETPGAIGPEHDKLVRDCLYLVLVEASRLVPNPTDVPAGTVVQLGPNPDGPPKAYNMDGVKLDDMRIAGDYTEGGSA
jgi:hypothetical protein